MIKETKNLTIKPGYKKTPIGIIPEEWVVKNFGDFLEFKNGVNASKKDYGKGVKFINVLEVITNLSLTNEEIPGEVEITEKQFERYKVEKGDILFNRTSETQEEIALSSVYLDDYPTVFGGFVIRGRFIKDFYLNAFKKYIFRNPDVRKQMISKGQGAVRVNIGQSDLEKISTPIPPLPEQKAIADCLSTWDKGIEKLTALIQSKKEQKKGLMQGFFSGKLKVENGELIQAKEGEDFTKGWKKIELKEILTYEQPTKYLSNNFNDLLNENKVPVLTANKSFVLGYTDENVGIYNKLPVIIFDDFTTASRLVDFSFKVKSSAIKFLQTKSNFNIYFIFERLQLIKIDTTTHKRRWISEFENMVLSIPTIMEQNAFAQFIQTADKEIELLEQKLEAFKIQKKGLMQVLLTGTKRLV